MKDQVLSIKQMQELIALGIDASKASMCWFPTMAIDTRTGKSYVENHYLSINHINSIHYWNTRVGKETIPTFTLQDILTFFNSYQTLKLSDGVSLEIRFNGRWVHGELGDNLLSIAFNMLKWCKQNNYI